MRQIFILAEIAEKFGLLKTPKFIFLKSNLFPHFFWGGGLRRKAQNAELLCISHQRDHLSVQCRA